MKNYFKRIFVTLLILTLVASSQFSYVQAKEKSYEKIKINVITSDGDKKESVEMLYDGRELYIPVTDIAKITKYKNTDSNNESEQVRYIRGEKAVKFSLNDDTVRLTNQNFDGKYAGSLNQNGKIYLPLSSVLPWLDASCYADKGTLIIENKPFTYYELTQQYDMDLQRFTAVDYFGGNSKTTGFVILGSKFIDNIFSLWNISDTVKKIIPDKEGNSYFDREIYEEAFISMAGEDVLESSGAKDVFGSLEHIRDLNDITSKMNLDFTKTDTSLIAGDFMLKYDVDAITQSKVYDFIDSFTALNIAAEAAGDLMPAIESIATFSASFNMAQEYYEGLTVLRDENKNNVTVNKAATEALNKLRKPITDLMEKYMDFFVDKGIDYFMDAGGAIVSDLIKLTVEVIYSDEMEAFSEMSKMTVYGDIETIARRLVTTPYTAVTPEEQHYCRVSMLMAILAAKNTAKALEKWDNIGNPNETLIKERIELCDEFITKLLLCEDGSEYKLMQPSSVNEDILGWEAESETNKKEIKKLMSYEQEEDVEITKSDKESSESSEKVESSSIRFESVNEIPKDKFDIMMEEMNDFAFDRATYFKYLHSNGLWQCQLIELDMVRCKEYNKDFFIGIYKLTDGEDISYIYVDTESIDKNSNWDYLCLHSDGGDDPEKLKNTYAYAGDKDHQLISLDISSYNQPMTHDNYFGIHGGYNYNRYVYGWDSFNWDCKYR